MKHRYVKWSRKRKCTGGAFVKPRHKTKMVHDDEKKTRYKEGKK